MNSVKCINTEFYGSSSNNSSSERGTTIFPSLKQLLFEDMPNLEEWQGIERDSQHTDPCPCLKQLTVKKCPKLKSLPSEILSFVRNLWIQGDKVIVRSLQNLDVLEYWTIKRYNGLLSIMSCPALLSAPVMNSSIVAVHISSCHSLKSLSQRLQYVPILEDLYIGDCDQLELSSQDFQNLISLRVLRLDGLPKLIYIPDLQHLSTLQNLTVRSCKSLTSLWPHAMQNLTVHLEDLTLEDCEQLKLSGADFQHLIKLRRIRLARLPELRSLPDLQHLHSLDSLFIHGCKNLKELPQWLQNLTSLQTLEIEGCDHDLESRCAEDSGEYWPFIKHIPKVRVSNPVWESDSDEETPPTTPQSPR